MGSRVGLIVSAMIAIGASVQGAGAAEAKTWYVYCEGAGVEGHWAVFSENFWPHPETADYSDRVGDAAKAFFEKRHDVSLEGCAGVKFRDDSLAEHSRQMTVQLHRRMGDRVYFFRLPNEILRQDPAPEGAVAPRAAAAGRDLAGGGGAATALSEDPQWRYLDPPAGDGLRY